MRDRLGNVDEIHPTELQKLIEKAKNRDARAFQTMFELLSDRLFKYAFSRSKSRDDALDIVQETFVELWKALEGFTYSSEGEFYGFVFIILKRRIYSYYKKTTLSVELEEHHITESFEIEIEDYRYLEKNMKKLPKNYQELLRLRYWSALTYSEIADFMNIREGTAKVWHHRAIRLLRGNLSALL